MTKMAFPWWRVAILMVSLTALALALAWQLWPWDGLGQAAAILNLVALAALLARAAMESQRGILPGSVLLVTVFAYLCLPLVLMVRGSMDDPSPGMVAGGLVLVALPLALGAIMVRPGGETRAAAGAMPDASGSSSSGSSSSGTAASGTTPTRRGRSLVACLFLVVLGLGALLLGISTYTVPDAGLPGVMIPQFLPYWAFAFLALGAMAWRFLRHSGWLGRWSVLATLPGLAAALVALLPLWQTPGVVAAADAAFRQAYGVDASTLSLQGGRAMPFSLGEFFLGAPPREAVSQLNQVYLVEMDSAGKSHRFTFDQWRPVQPGVYPALIRIHGGAWVIGDKGPGNMGGMNRWFASQGYQVFDIQYGLNDSAKFALSAPTPAEVLGPWSIDDMVRQISAFSSYVADHAAELGVDPSRIFVSGGSAGGQLALASVLAGSSGFLASHPGLGFDPRLKVKGLIPYYPANGSPAQLGIPADPALNDPTALLSPQNPPALIYQGVIDGMVPIERTRTFALAYGKTGAAIAVVEFPSAGHGSDLLFWNPYNQVFTWYMERFMTWAATR